MIKNLKIVRQIELIPHNQKSYYGKAIIALLENGDSVLFSYNTPVIRKTSDGKLYRLWSGWSETTQKHIKAFCGLNKASFLALPIEEF